MAAIESDPGWAFLRPSWEQQAAEAGKTFDSQVDVWVPDAEDGFTTATVLKRDGDSVFVRTAAGTEKEVKSSEVDEQNPPKFECAEDMSDLTYLSDAGVLHNLRARYAKMMIYTYSGLFCVVINPYKRLPIYSEALISAYIGRRRIEMPPHLFAAADEAFRAMLMDKENQSLLITGESGAGKTENTKKVIAYYAKIAATEAKEKKGSLEEQIVQTNPVLEAFGNAKTVRNNNSSRFGKFIRVHFSKEGKLSGGDIEHYLLEKSRAVRQSPGERCYHIFYQIMSGHLPNLRKELELDEEIHSYHFVSQAEVTIDGVDDKDEHRLTEEAFDVMGFEAQEKSEMYALCAAMMHMGEMAFKQRAREEQAEADGAEAAGRACRRFGVDADAFLHSLVSPSVRVGSEWVSKGQNLEQVDWAVRALGKAIYARQFAWLIARCNRTLDAKEIPRHHFIGVLDIAGFEIFDFNSFEQLWINFVNEKLQQFFNHHMFVLEQEEYALEGIQWDFIDFGLDLQACIDLIEKPLGIISMMDEECIVPKATDLTLAEKLSTQHLGKHANFQMAKPPKGGQAEAHFALVHYAGTVRYNVGSWLEKNKDPLNDSAVAVLKTSTENRLLGHIWADYVTQSEAAEAAKAGADAPERKAGKSGSFQTVSHLYRQSLASLMAMLQLTHPHFIRCIIPNEQKASGLIEAALVLNQLKCNGVLEGIRICRKGFPNRMLYPDFMHRYALLAADAAKAGKDLMTQSGAVLKQLTKEELIIEDNFRLGKNKVFFKSGVLGRLEDARDKKLSVIILSFQTLARWYLARLYIRKILMPNMPEPSPSPEPIPVVDDAEIQRLKERIDSMTAELSAAAAARASAEAATAEARAALQQRQAELAEEKKTKERVQAQAAALEKDKARIETERQKAAQAAAEAESRADGLTAKNRAAEQAMTALEDKIGVSDARAADVARAKAKVEGELENAARHTEEMELGLRKLETEKQAQTAQLQALQDELAAADQAVARANKEKKAQEEQLRRFQEDLTAEEGRSAHMGTVRGKLERQMEEFEEALEREKRLRMDADKLRRKAEQELKLATENLDEVGRQKHDTEQSLKRQEIELHHTATRLEDESSIVAKLQRQVKELQGRCGELEEEVEVERSSRGKAERLRSELQRELEELSDRLDEAGGLTSAQVELSKRREVELAKLRREAESSHLMHEEAMGELRKRHNSSVAELGDQLDALQKIRARLDKDKMGLERELAEAAAQADADAKSRADLEKKIKAIELQLNELQIKADEQVRQIGELCANKARLTAENNELSNNLEEAETTIGDLQRAKSSLAAMLEETKRACEEEARERASIALVLKNAEHENDSLRSQLDDEEAARADLLRQASRLNAEVLQWKAKWETEHLGKLEEIEEAKRVLLGQLSDCQQALEAANIKCSGLDKIRVKLLGELEDAAADVERAAAYSAALEKKARQFDAVLSEWRAKCDGISAELDSAQREARNLATENFRLKGALEEQGEALEGVRRENRNLTMEVKDLTDQLTEGGRSVHELQKMVRRLELEKEELQTALDEAEAALEAEEAKVLRAQVEVAQIRSEIEKRIQEKEEEFEATRKNHQRAIESMQASLEAESKAKVEALRVKKKLEADLNEMEVALDQANKAYTEAQRTIKKYVEQVRELQMAVEEEQRIRDELQAHLTLADQRNSALQQEKAELTSALENAERNRRAAEADAHEQREAATELGRQVGELNNIRRKLEAEGAAMAAELDETLRALQSSEERGRKAAADAAQLAEELRQEQEHSQHIERMRKGLEMGMKELQARLEEAEKAALMGGKKLIAKLEARLREVEGELDGEQRRHQETEKSLRGRDRRVRELEFQVDEDRKDRERIQDLAEKLTLKLKTYKRQVEEAEEVANLNLAKYRTLQLQLVDSEERADMAENCLAKVRSRVRTGGLMHSATAGGGASGLVPAQHMGGSAANLHSAEV